MKPAVSDKILRDARMKELEDDPEDAAAAALFFLAALWKMARLQTALEQRARLRLLVPPDAAQAR